MGAIIIGLRPGDHEDLKQLAQRVGRPAKEVAGILLERAIRHEAGTRVPAEQNDAGGSPDRVPAA